MKNRFKMAVAVENHGQKRHISHSRFGDEIGADKNRGCVLANVGVMYVTYHQISLLTVHARFVFGKQTGFLQVFIK